MMLSDNQGKSSKNSKRKSKKKALSDAIEEELQKKEASEEESSILEDSDSLNKIEKKDFFSINLKNFKFKKINKNLVRISILTIFLSCIFLLGYFLLFDKTSSVVYLSTSQIARDEIKILEKEKSVFTLNKPIFIFFDAGSPLGTENIVISIIELKEKSKGNVLENIIGEFTVKIKSTFRSFETYFQKDYFTSYGKYKIQILKPNGELLAQKIFFIKAHKK